MLICVTLFDGGDELGELGLVLRADLGQRKNSGSLLVDDCAETSLAFDNLVCVRSLDKRREHFEASLQHMGLPSCGTEQGGRQRAQLGRHRWGSERGLPSCSR
jgi:hypothetical protein